MVPNRSVTDTYYRHVLGSNVEALKGINHGLETTFRFYDQEKKISVNNDAVLKHPQWHRASYGVML